jgi:hypothetical protein
MAEAPNIITLFIILQIVIAYYFVKWILNSPSYLRHLSIRPPSLRRMLRHQRRFRPKHQLDTIGSNSA